MLAQRFNLMNALIRAPGSLAQQGQHLYLSFYSRPAVFFVSIHPSDLFDTGKAQRQILSRGYHTAAASDAHIFFAGFGFYTDILPEFSQLL